MSLMHANGAPDVPTCSFCGTDLPNERACANIKGRGVKFFCAATIGDKPEDSCFNQYRMRVH